MIMVMVFKDDDGTNNCKSKGDKENDNDHWLTNDDNFDDNDRSIVKILTTIIKMMTIKVMDVSQL